VLFPTKQSLIVLGIASGKVQERPRSDMIKEAKDGIAVFRLCYYKVSRDLVRMMYYLPAIFIEKFVYL
jgi:hypothetical protein